MRISPRALLKVAGGIGALALAYLAGSYDFADSDQEQGTTFHDMRVLTPASMTQLVTPAHPRVVELARRLGTFEEAYLYVRDRIAYDAALPVAPPAEVIEAGAASCMSKAALLASLYRALGMDDEEVRVVTGQVYVDGQPIEHAWLELEYYGRCLQQDATTLLGVFEFGEFKDTAFTRTYVWRELFCFNDKGFAVVSQRNRFRGMQDPHLKEAPGKPPAAAPSPSRARS
jgi:transglutaminase-like putative cysteine protease